MTHLSLGRMGICIFEMTVGVVVSNDAKFLIIMCAKFFACKMHQYVSQCVLLTLPVWIEVVHERGKVTIRSVSFDNQEPVKGSPLKLSAVAPNASGPLKPKFLLPPVPMIDNRITRIQHLDGRTPIDRIVQLVCGKSDDVSIVPYHHDLAFALQIV